MILPDKKEALHKAMMYRLLIALLDDKELSHCLYFKGGTCAAMLGYLDRFSIDLDFDLKYGRDKKKVRKLLKKIFSLVNFSLKQESAGELFFILKYDAPATVRNTLKLGILTKAAKANTYKALKLTDIGRYAICQTKETMFANKLVAVTDRFKKYHTIAGRDIYDIHHFYLRGFDFNREVIRERTGKDAREYFLELINFIGSKVSWKQLREDLSPLLPLAKFRAIEKSLKEETLSFLNQEVTC